jgi:hypothetical protein
MIKVASNLTALALIKASANQGEGPWQLYGLKNRKKINLKFPYSPDDFYETMSDDDFSQKLNATINAIDTALMKGKFPEPARQQLGSLLLNDFLSKVK